MSIEKKEKQKELILNTALEIANSKTWTDVSIRKISQKINYSTILIYSLFGSKENLFIELRKLGFKQLLNSYMKDNLMALSKEESIAKLSDLTIKFYLENRRIYQLMFGVIGIPGVQDICEETNSATQTASFIKELISSKMKGDRNELFYNWWALIHGFISIGINMSSNEFLKLKPFINKSISRFIKE